MPEIYDAVADDYDWLFSDQALKTGVAITQPATARLLSRLDHSRQLLDAACGTGVDAAVLARRGFRMSASDASSLMISRARERFAREALQVTAFEAKWPELPEVTDTRFDAVLCIGNSLVHAAGGEAMEAALRGIRGVLKTGGVVAVDSRNWEKLHRERRSLRVADRAVVRDGKRCIVVYSWNIPQAFEDEHVAHLGFIFDDGKILRTREQQIGFRPFTIDALRERLRAAGLEEIDTDFDPQVDRYSIVATASSILQLHDP